MMLDSFENSESYKKTLSDAYPNQQIFSIDIITTLINKYGDIDTSTGEKTMMESKLDSILSLVLGEGKDIFITCEITPEFGNALICYYDTNTGEVLIKLR